MNFKFMVCSIQWFHIHTHWPLRFGRVVRNPFDQTYCQSPVSDFSRLEALNFCLWSVLGYIRIELLIRGTDRGTDLAIKPHKYSVLLFNGINIVHLGLYRGSIVKSLHQSQSFFTQTNWPRIAQIKIQDPQNSSKTTQIQAHTPQNPTLTIFTTK